MRVFVVASGESGEGQEIDGVFLDKKDALAFAVTTKAEYEGQWESLPSNPPVIAAWMKADWLIVTVTRHKVRGNPAPTRRRAT